LAAEPTASVALVVGGASGIGRAVAERLSTTGPVVIADTDQERGQAVADELRSRNRRVEFIAADASLPGQMETAVERCMDKFGRVDTAVLSVLRDERASILELAPQQWDEIVDVGLKSGYSLARAVIPAMIRAGGGSLLFVSSIHAIQASGGSPAYAAAKAGLCGLVRQLAVEFGRDLVRVNAVLPAFTVTPPAERLLQDGAFRSQLIRTFPLGRLGQPEDVASAIAFLASPEASFITGTAIPVDGGASVQMGTHRIWEDFNL
jgi:NAD(P)-dependent dehydrogenase (short-subunit alcohol dehydrogenase family)